MRPVRRISIGLLFCGITAAAELVPFAPPWNDTAPGPTDLRATIEKPAGMHGFIQARNGHLFAGERRIKLFGVNLTAAANFPDHTTADAVASRMAKFGINAARFHFLDANWGTPRLIRYGTGEWNEWDAEALDRFDYFFARLKGEGIYGNINLLVGRNFGVADGIASEIRSVPEKTAHALGFFHAPLFEAQKGYARRLLTHRNPYTGLRYSDDPAVAMVEINNENGLLHTWFSGTMDHLPDVFARDLREQWNAWLAQHYPNTTALARAWKAVHEPLGAEMLAPGDLRDALTHWNLERHSCAQAEALIQHGEVRINVRRPGQEGWHVQFNHPHLAVRGGTPYTLRFSARADHERRIHLSLMQAHDPWQDLGFATDVTLTPEPKEFSFTFLLREGDTNARLNFGNLNQDDAAFSFRSISLRPGGAIGLAEGESLEARTLALPQAKGERALTPDGHRDWVQFLWETERNHWVAMRDFLKNDLGLRAPIVGTIVATSTPNLMSLFDIVDTHAYWHHPTFPGKPWDRNNWYVPNQSMIEASPWGILRDLALNRVAGKPHMVSEYNHPAPNVHAGEGPLFLAAAAARQDWDAIFLYTYSHDETKTKAGRIPDFFDISQHPTIMANVPIASILFRRGDISPAPQVKTLPLPVKQEIALIAKHGRSWSVLPTSAFFPEVPDLNLFRYRLALLPEPPPPQFPASSFGKMAWTLTADTRPIFTYTSPRSVGFIGHADNQTISLGEGIQVTIHSTLAQWNTLALTLLEGGSLIHNPRRALLVLTGHTENTDMGWKNENKTTVGSDWGKPPSLVEPISADITFKKPGGIPTIFALDDRGQRLSPALPASSSGNAVTFRLGASPKTLWYEVAWPGSE